MHRRAGFTLVEVLIAVVLIDVGLLALVAAGSILVRRATELRLRAVAVRAAVDRLQLIGVGACVGANGATIGSGDVRENWEATAPTNGVRELYDSVTFIVAGVEKAVALRTRLPC
jgi:Tfp pilus assembly protein PilV